MSKEKKLIQIENIMARIVLICIGVFGFLNASMKPLTYMEIDSYVMPIISLQYRGSFVIEPQDIEQAKIDFPSLYSDVNSYDDFRSSKLKKIDETHWTSFYFPVYAVFCLPLKLLLQIMHLDQMRCFLLTNVLFLWMAMYCLIRFFSKEKKEGTACAVLMCCSPIWYYIQYIGAEPIMFSLTVFSYLLWRNKHYNIAAVIISVTSMMNPTFIGIGVVMFFEYIFSVAKGNRKFYLEKNEIKKIIILCSCYIPSLIPFVFNKIKLGVWNPTMSSLSENNKIGETLLRRFVAYIFDLNFGIAAISIVVVLLFIGSIIYSSMKRDRMVVYEWMSVLLVMGCFSLMFHINCGMLNCARYVMWIYPGVILVVCDTVFKLFNRNYVKSFLVLAGCALSCLFVAKVNGTYTYLEYNNISKFVLDRVPEVYISVCPSTFNSRTNHIDGGYYTGGITVYKDSKTNEVRKIMYYNTEENRQILMSSFISGQDSDLSVLKDKLSQRTEEKVYFISIGRKSKVQYLEK